MKISTTKQQADAPVIEVPGINRDFLKELLREVVAEETPASALHDAEPGRAKRQDRDLAQEFIRQVTNREPKPRPVTVNLTGAVKKLEAAEKVLEFMNPDLEGKTRKWGRNPQSRKEALALANHCVKEALTQLRVKVKASMN